MDPQADAPPDPLNDALLRGRAWLTSTRNADGSWGYLPDQEGRPEPTLLAAAAGAGLASAWLDGAELGWAELLLPAVAWEADRALAKRSLDRVLAAQAELTDAEGFDGQIPGWSWVDGTAAWVEPTSYALCSLQKAGFAGHDRAVRGRELLIDRQCSDSGWNYGNPETLGTRLEGQIAPTAWACLALPIGEEAAARGLVFLGRAISQPSTLALALGALAFARHNRDPAPFTTRLAPRLDSGSIRDRVDLTALAVAALAAHLENERVFWR